jgi:ribosomal protein S18 acetylase RimI-like enzyme
MIRKRNPARDDRKVLAFVEQQLLPYARKTTPGIRVTMKSIKKRLDGGATYVAHTAGSLTVGFISLIRKDHVMYVDMLAVHPGYQGKGYGSALMRWAERAASLKGCGEVRLWVDEANTGAQKFYSKLGFTPIHFEQKVNCYLMVKPI